MRNQIVWAGLEELKTQLRQLPRALVTEASGLVTGAADGAKRDLHYPGDLGDRVFVKTIDVGPFAAKAVITNPHPLAKIYEDGTKARHYFTKKRGVKHLTGAMPATHVFVRAVIRRRRAMYDQLKTLIETHGLTVSGEV